jgi:hypothetical protein
MAEPGTVHYVMTDGRAVDEALQRVAVAARREYMRAGLSMPVWRKGRLVWVEPTELKQYDADGHTATLGHDGAKGTHAGRRTVAGCL